MRIFLIIFFTISFLVAMFCLWVLCKMAGNSNDMEEQMEIERKLKNNGKR